MRKPLRVFRDSVAVIPEEKCVQRDVAVEDRPFAQEVEHERDERQEDAATVTGYRERFEDSFVSFFHTMFAARSIRMSAFVMRDGGELRFHAVSISAMISALIV
jgi:hypothetical protein